jgi:hypothetical protein
MGKMKMAKTKTQGPKTETIQTQRSPTDEEMIRMAAYYNWENQTGGNPVDEEQTRQFWLAAEQQLAQDQPPTPTNGNNGH